MNGTPRGAVIAVDTLGGDNAPANPVAGAALALTRNPHLRFLLFGSSEELQRLVSRHARLAAVSEIVEAPQAVADDAKPSTVLRRGGETSLYRALESVRDGKAQAMVSAGNTGAFMVLAHRLLSPMEGVHRPAMAAFMPTHKGASVFLDLGATLQCNAANLVQFGVMGHAFAQAVQGIEKPRTALLNIGSEEGKGHESLREAAQILSRSDLAGEFIGFVEGHELALGKADVIVADGFSGNIALKTAEGIAKLYTDTLTATFRDSLLGRLGYLLLRGSVRRHFRAFDARRYNGAVFLGVEGLAVKSHGRLDALGFSYAVAMAANLAEREFLHRVRSAVAAASAMPTGAETDS